MKARIQEQRVTQPDKFLAIFGNKTNFTIHNSTIDPVLSHIDLLHIFTPYLFVSNIINSIF